MTKSELIQTLAHKNPQLLYRDIEKVVSTIFDEISFALAKTYRVELRGFGVFGIKKRDARAGRNPRTGDKVSVDSKAVPYFKVGKILHQRLNGLTVGTED